MKVIPAVDLLGGKVVRLVKGDPNNKTIYSDDPVGTAKKWAAAGADALHVVDLDATLTSGSNAETVSRIAKEAGIPVQAAGGIRSFELASTLLGKVDRVVLGTLAYRQPEAVERLLKEFGSDRIIVAIDQKQGKVMIDGWRSSTGADVLDSMARFKEMGARYFLLTSIERDGTLLGPDTDILGKACSMNVDVFASGGISGNDDIVRVKQTGAYAVILGKALYDGWIDVKSVKMIAG